MTVLGTKMYEEGMEMAVAEFLRLSALSTTSNLLVSPSDANVLVHARRNKDFNKILSSYFWNLPDGVPSVWVLKLKGAKGASRCSGPDFFENVIKESVGSELTHYLCGGGEGVADELKRSCEGWGNEKVVGTNTPAFKDFQEADYQKLAQEIEQKKPDVIWIGLGAPKQLTFAHELSQFVNVKFIVTIGAAFDFHTGRVKKAPKWMQKCGLEWFYRLLQEPRRLGKRYFKVVPLFLWYNFIGLFKKRKRN